MTKRPLYTREEVLQGLLDGSDQDSDLSDFSDTEYCNDPMADGSDDDFMDLHEEEGYSQQYQDTPTQFKDACEYVIISQNVHTYNNCPQAHSKTITLPRVPFSLTTRQNTRTISC